LKDINTFRGLQRDTLNLVEGEYATLLNGVFDGVDEGTFTLSNEMSNVLSSKFKEGFKVIGVTPDPFSDTTYFFLVNPETGTGEFGKIKGTRNYINIEDALNSCDECNNSYDLNEPLEEQDQLELDIYETVLTDNCIEDKTTGFNFNINYPIKKSIIKNEKCGKTIYFTDNYNEYRYITIDNIEQYLLTGNTVCGVDNTTPTCLDATKLPLIRKYNRPTIEPISIELGGRLLQGVYEAIIAYCDKEGNTISEFSSNTTPVSIFDQNNVVQEPSLQQPPTNYSIKFEVSNLDQNYQYYKVAIIQTTLDSQFTPRVFIEGIHNITDTTVVYSGDQNKVEITLSDLFRENTYIQKGALLAEANNSLVLGDLTIEKEINLQPIVNLLGTHFKWQTFIASEDFFKDGVASAKYLGVNRDEVVPYSIRFLLDGGFKTAVFPLIGRKPTDDDLDYVVETDINGNVVFGENGNLIPLNDNLDVSSILASKNQCKTTDRTKYWQYYNTASTEGQCFNENVDVIDLPESVEKTCYLENLTTVPSGVISITTDTFFNGLSEFIEDNYIEGSCQNELIGTDICTYLSDDYEEVCGEGLFANMGVECTTPEILSEEVQVQEIINEVSQDIEFLFPTEYKKILPPQNAVIYKIDYTTGNPKRDLDLENSLKISPIYFRNSDFYNEDCTYSEDIINTQVTNTNVNTAYFNNYKVGNTTEELLTSKIINLNTYSEVLIFDSGTTGTVNITIAGTVFVAEFDVNLNTTASNFVTTHGSNIELATGATVSVLGNTVKIDHPETGFVESIIQNALSDMIIKVEGNGFTKKLGKNAIFFNIDDTREKYIVELSKQKFETNNDKINRLDSQNVRLSLFKKCSNTEAIYSEIIDLNSGGMLYFEKSGLDLTLKNTVGVTQATIVNGWSSKYIISVDTQIVLETFDNNPSLSLETYVQRRILTPTDGAFTVTKRDIEISRKDITWDSIILKKKIVYQATCKFTQPVVNKCEALPFEYGKFAYWESQETYADNKSLFDSSNLVIEQSDIPIEYRDEFEENFVEAIVNGVYVLNEDTDFRCKAIRHFKFPDNKVSPYISSSVQAPFTETYIFPLGVSIDENLINSYLDIAVKNQIISQEKRNLITGYEVLRGDISQNRSVVSSGLLFDMRSYEEKGKTKLYSNYPYNAFGKDKLNLNANSLGNSNSKFTFHSPETDYYRPTIPTELSVQGYMFGKANIQFDEVKDHPKWVILSNRAKDLANLLAGVEASAEIVIASAQVLSNAQIWFVGGPGSTGSSLGIPALTAFAMTTGLGLVSGVLSKFGKYRYEWLETFEKLGQPENFAYYCYSTESKYNYLQLLQEEQQQLRGVNKGKHIKDGEFTTTNEVTKERVFINNIDREWTTFLDTGDFPITYIDNYIDYDNNDSDSSSSSLSYLSENGGCSTGKSAEYQKNIASPYIALKNYIPNQYGTLNSITWLTTGYRGDLANPKDGCLPIFGGDTFIAPHTLKRKIPLFNSTVFGQADFIPFNYKFYNNIGKTPKFFVDYRITTELNRQNALFPEINYDFSFDCENRSGNYYKNPSKFYLYYYGIPNFMVETRINTWNRTAQLGVSKNFYPNTTDMNEFTQEKNVSVKQPNYYFYNQVYSKNVTQSATRTLQDFFNQEEADCRNDKPNGIMWSQPDNSENNYNDPWLNFKPLDFFEFPTSWGRLKDLKTIENEQILVKFENTTALHNSVDMTIDDGKNPEYRNLLSAFARRPMLYSETDLGFGGTFSTQSVSCEFGHFHVDSKRGQILHIPPGGKGMQEISSLIGGKPSGLRNWFKEHLPFKILRENIQGIENLDTDNAYNGVGITMGYDSRFRRVFITKKDYILKPQQTGFIRVTEGRDFEYVNGSVVTKITVNDSTYFEDVSWTISYSPIEQRWVGWYSYHPNYYVAHNNYFQTGKNTDNDTFGLWSHLLTNRSYQVFYGQKYPFVVEYVNKKEYGNTLLTSVDWLGDIRRYHNEFDWAEIEGKPFNKLNIWSKFTNSGDLELIPNTGQLSLLSKYPKTSPDGATQQVLVSRNEDRYSVNYFYNRILKSNSNNPHFNWDRNQILKEVNTDIVKFTGKSVLEVLKSNLFHVKLQQDADSRLRYTLDIIATNKNANG
jgi:hypothetical protein